MINLNRKEKERHKMKLKTLHIKMDSRREGWIKKKSRLKIIKMNKRFKNYSSQKVNKIKWKANNNKKGEKLTHQSSIIHLIRARGEWRWGWSNTSKYRSRKFSDSHLNFNLNNNNCRWVRSHSSARMWMWDGSSGSVVSRITVSSARSARNSSRISSTSMDSRRESTSIGTSFST